MSRRKRPTDPEGVLPTPQWWKEALKDWLDEKRGRRVELAEAVDCTPGAITKLLKPRPTRSGLVAAICDYTGIPRPVVVVDEERQERQLRWHRALPGLSDADYNHLVELAESLQKRSG